MAIRRKLKPGCPVIRRAGKTAKLTVQLPEDLAGRLRAYAAFHALDLGDVVASGLDVVLRGFSVVQRSAGERFDGAIPADLDAISSDSSAHTTPVDTVRFRSTGSG